MDLQRSAGDGLNRTSTVAIFVLLIALLGLSFAQWRALDKLSTEVRAVGETASAAKDAADDAKEAADNAKDAADDAKSSADDAQSSADDAKTAVESR